MDRALTADILTAVATQQQVFADAQSEHRQAELGQFFTPAPVARFMASLATDLPEEIRILDPGAGAGALSAALCERIAALRSPRRVEIHAYEQDAKVLPLLASTLEKCARSLHRRGHSLRWHVHPRDFILQGPSALGGGLFAGDRFDVAILNPPYFKIAKDSPQAAVMADVVHGQPNIYALFMATALDALRPGGRFISITPRSFCSGPYFSEFRRWFFARLDLERLHLYASRTDTFSEAEVLQESVITCGRRAASQQPTLRVSIGETRNDANHARVTTHGYPSRFIIHGGDSVVRLPGTEREAAALRSLDRLRLRLADLGLRVSTGPIVAFRCAGRIGPDGAAGDRVPLFSLHSVAPHRLTWPPAAAKKAKTFSIEADPGPLVLPAANYVLLRRFTAKEEARRVVAAPYLSREHGDRPVAIENHLNYITKPAGGLTVPEALGLTAYLNSSVVDDYLRAVSGNTQVNAAELRALPLLSMETLAALGQTIAKRGIDPATLEDVNGQVEAACRDQGGNGRQAVA